MFVHRKLDAMSCFCETYPLGKYTCFPLLDRAPRRSDFNCVIEQVELKLAYWRVRCISFPGRVILSKFDIKAIHIYIMMITSIAKACSREIQKLQRSFIWGDNEEHIRVDSVK